MPKITITTSESVSTTSASATSTVVLLPIFAKEGKAISHAPTYYGKNYSTNFTSDWNSDVLKCTANNNAPDPSYTAAQLLINSGLNVLVVPVEYPISSEDDPTEDSWADFKKALSDELNAQIIDGLYEDFKSVSSYNISYITTGAHCNLWMTKTPANDSSEETYKLSLNGCYYILSGIAESRGDCVALVELTNLNDSTDGLSYSPSGLTTAVSGVTGNQTTILSVIPSNQNCAMFYPWCMFSAEYYPAGIGYLKAFGNSLQTNEDWLAVAGVNRGIIPDCSGVQYEVTEALAEQLQGTTNAACINPIMKVNNYGLRVWGNRTGQNSTTSFYTYLNIKVLVNLIRKQIVNAAAAVTFEPNDDITWVNFKSLVNTLLDRMVSGRGIRSYAWVRNETTAKATINATLIITPIEAVENFTININLRESSDTETTTVEIV